MTTALATTAIELPSDLRIASKNGTLTYPWHQFFDQLKNIAIAQEALFANVKDYGALGDGSTDDTIAIQAALDSGFCEIFVPCGTYPSGTISIPSTTSIRRIFGSGNIVANNLAANANLLTLDGPGNIVIEGLTFTGFGLTSNPLLGISSTSSNLHIKGCVFEGGRFGIGFNTVGASSCWITENQFDSYDQAAISAGPGGVTNIHVNDNFMFGGTCIGHSITLGDTGATQSQDCHVNGNYIQDGTQFGIHFHSMVRGMISNNTTHNTTLEGINIGGNSNQVTIQGNTVNHDAGNGTDVGISINGDDGTHVVKFTTITGNRVIKAFKGGILVADFSQNTDVTNNHIFDCNQSNGVSAPSAITISGATAVRVTAFGNIAMNVDSGRMPYIVAEDTGANYTYAANNYGRAMITGLTNLTGVNSVALGNVALPN